MGEATRIFVDANVFVDVIEERLNWNNSYEVLEKVRERELSGFVSALTVAILYFRRRRIRADKDAREEVRSIIRRFTVVDMTSSILDEAFDNEKFDDFEDAVQFHSARQSNAIIITRNKKDFRKVSKEIEVLTPEEFLKKY